MRLRHLLLFALALALTAGCGGSGGGGVDPRFSGAFGTIWEPLATAPAEVTGCPGFSDYTPAGETGFFSLQDTEGARFTPAGGWVPIADAPIDFNCWPGPAWVGNALYVIRENAVHAYDILGDTWSIPVPTGVAATDAAQMTHDDAGHVYAVETVSPFRMVRYTIATNSVDYLDTGGFSGVAVSQPRIAWDSIHARLYVAPNAFEPRLFSFDPAAPGSTVELASVPAAGGGVGTGIGDMFTGDRSGHLYAQGDTGCSDSNTVFQYDIATDTWIRLPNLPESHGCNGAATVSDDGWLYVTPGDNGNLYRIELF